MLAAAAVVARPCLVDWILRHHALVVIPLVWGVERINKGLVLIFEGSGHVVVLVVEVEVLHVVGGWRVGGHLVVEAVEHGVGNLHALLRRLVDLIVARRKKPVKIVLLSICPLRLAGSHHRQFAD